MDPSLLPNPHPSAHTPRLIRNSIMQHSPRKSNHKMNHNTSIIRPMPMCNPRRSPDNIPSHQYLRHAASIADPVTTSNDSDHLALLTV